jgi:hypothetical protein
MPLTREFKESDIDLMIISDSPTYGEVFGALERVTRAVGRKTMTMSSPSPLERLAGPGGVLAKEPPDANEFAGVVRSGITHDRPTA